MEHKKISILLIIDLLLRQWGYAHMAKPLSEEMRARFGRQLLAVRAQIFLAAGLMRMPARKFLFADALSALISMAIMIGIGYFCGSQIQILRENMARLNRMILFFLVLIVLGWSLLRYY